MATQLDFTGYAAAHGLNGAPNTGLRHSLTTSWNGRSFFRYNRTTSNTSVGQTFKNWTQLGTVTDGQLGRYRTRIVFRLPTVAPNVARSIWFGIGGASTYQVGGVLIDTDRTLKCYTNIVNGGPYVAGSASAAVPLGYAGDREGWCTLDITMTVTASGTNDVIDVSCDITHPDGSTETITASTGATNLSTPNLSNYGLFSVPASVGFTSSWIGAIDFGLWWQAGATDADVASLPAFPPADVRVREVRITGQGSNNGIAYSSGATYRNLRKPWLYGTITTGDRLTTSTAGQQSDFTHEGVGQFGAAQTYGLKIVQVAQATGTPTGQFMVGGSNVAGLGALTSSGEPKYVDGTQRSQATFDALQVGVQSAVTAGTYDCNKIQIEVLHDGGKYASAMLDKGAGYQQEWLTWTGDGSAARTLTGLSFQPQFMYVLAPGQSSLGPHACAALLGDHAFVGNGGPGGGNVFYGFTSDGVELGGNLNTNAQDYLALCIRDDGTPTYDVSGPTPVITGYEFRFQVGGLAELDDTIDFGTERAMAPGLVWIHPGNNRSSGVSLYKFAAMGSAAPRLNTVSNATANLINSIDANGFTCGTSLPAVTVNTDPALYWSWSTATDLAPLLVYHQVAPAQQNIAASTDINYRISFEEDTDSAVTRAVIGTVTHPAPATGGSVTTLAASHTTDSGSHRGLLVIASTYGTSGTLSCDYGGVTVPTVYAKVNTFRKTRVFYLDAPTVGAATLTVTNSTSVSSIAWTAYAIRDTYGIRTINSSTVSTSAGDNEVSARLKDIVISHVASDPLDSGSSLATPGGWTELFNDGTISNACVSSWANGIADTAMAPAYTLTGSSDVDEHCVVALMPAALPAWNPYVVFCKGNYTSAQAAAVRMDTAYFSGATCISYANMAASVSDALVALDDYTVSAPRQPSVGVFRESEGWYVALGPDGIVTESSPPTGVDDTYETPVNTTLIVAAPGVLDNDDDNGSGAMTAVLVDDVTNGTLTLNANGSFTYVPDTDYIGDDTFTYTPVSAGGTGTLAEVTITVTPPVPPEPGGEIEPGENPEPSEVPTGLLRRFFTLTKFNGDILGAADTDFFADPVEWYGGYKPAELLSVAPIERELPRTGEFRGMDVRVVLSDPTRRWRALAAAEALSTAYAAVYLITDETRYALGVPHRIIAGTVVSHRALEHLQYEIIIRDFLSERMAYLDMAPKVPNKVLTESEFPGLYDRSEGTAAPILIGEVSDEDEDVPQGVVPPLIVAGLNLSYFGGASQSVIAALFSMGAVAENGIWRIYYNPPTTPSVRELVPDVAYGGPVWAPGHPGWSETGLTTDYVDYPLPAGPDTRRYTPVFFDATHALAEPYLNGQVIIAGNVFGVSENGDGSGLYISDPSRAWAWLLINQLFVPYSTGDYAAVPVVDDYQLIDMDTVERTRTRQRARLTDGYPVGFMVGRDGQQQTMRHILQELCLGTDMQQGINRHGQLMVDTEDADATPVATLTDLIDIRRGDFEITVDRDWYFNTIERYHGFRYVAPTAPNPAPAEGEPVPTPVTPYNPWLSKPVTQTHTASVTANRGTVKTYVFENYVVRKGDVQSDIATRLLDRAVGPSPSYDGPRVFRLSTTVDRVLYLELGDNIRITHVDGYGATGYEGAIGRVMKIRLDTDQWVATIEGYILTEAPSE